MAGKDVKHFKISLVLYRFILQNDILKIIQSDRVSVIQKYIEDYLILLRAKINDLTTELATQSSLCPSTLPPLEVIDTRLKEFVRLHHIDLIRTVNYQTNKLKDDIREKQLFQQLSYYYLTSEQVLIIDQIL